MKDQQKKSDIQLYNRYDNNVYLAHVDGSLYKLYMEGCLYFSPHYDGDKLVAIDPDGGPYIAIGMKVDGQRVIKDITWDDVCNCYLVVVE